MAVYEYPPRRKGHKWENTYRDIPRLWRVVHEGQDRCIAPTCWFHWERAVGQSSMNQGQHPEELPVPGSTVASSVNLNHVLVIILAFYNSACAIPSFRVWTNLVLYKNISCPACWCAPTRLHGAPRDAWPWQAPFAAAAPLRCCVGCTCRARWVCHPSLVCWSLAMLGKTWLLGRWCSCRRG